MSILALFVVLGLFYISVTPLFESPDESSHLQIIRYLAQYRRLPAPVVLTERIATGPAMAESLRYHEPPLYYTPPLYHILGALLTVWTPMDDLEARLIPNPAWEAGWSPQRDADPWNKNVFVHLPGETWQDSPTMRAALTLRLLSVALGCVIVTCTYAITRDLCPARRALAAGAAALVALNPQFLALSAGVTNDPMLIALGSLFLLLALRAMARRAVWRTWAALGALVGVGLLVKQSALLLLPVGALAILGQGDAGRLPPWRKILADGLAFAIGAGLVGGAWYAYNGLTYGDWSGLAPHFASQMLLARFGLREATAVFETYWAGFGWALLSAPGWWYGLLAALVLLSIGGAARSAVNSHRGHRGHREKKEISALFAPSAVKIPLPVFTRRGLEILASALILNLLSLARWALATGAPYGRLLFPVQAAIAVGLAWGLAGWRRLHVLRLSVAVLGVFSLLTPWTILRPAFATPRVKAITQAAQTVDAAFADGPTLRGYQTRPTGETLRAGDVLPVTLYWQANAAPQPRYTTWIQLSPQDATRRIAEDNRWLGGTLYPTDFWQAGDVIRQNHTLRVPTAPFGLYWARLGLTTEDGARVSLSNGGDTVTLGPWRIRPENTPTPDIPLTYRLDDGIALDGYGVSLCETLVLTLTWKAQRAPTQDYVVFVHWVDNAGVMLSQHDGPPASGRYPTSWWLPGDVIPDAFQLPLPDSVPPPTVILRVGMYLPAIGTRLPLYDAAGVRLPDDMAVWQIPLSDVTCAH